MVGDVRSPASGPIAVMQDCTVRRSQFELGPVSMSLRAGSLLCLIGSNGAGKTTLLELMVGLLEPTVGRVLICGEPVDPVRRRHLTNVGYVPDDPGAVIEELSAWEYWNLVARIQARAAGRKTAAAVLKSTKERTKELVSDLKFEKFHPPRALHKPLGSYSHGMLKQTQLVAALSHGPKLLVVDEPANGLDPIVFERVQEILLKERLERGVAVLCATHDLAWAESNADEIAVIDDGKFLASGPVSSITLPGESLKEAFFRLVNPRWGDVT